MMPLGSSGGSRGERPCVALPPRVHCHRTQESECSCIACRHVSILISHNSCMTVPGHVVLCISRQGVPQQRINATVFFGNNGPMGIWAVVPSSAHGPLCGVVPDKTRSPLRSRGLCLATATAAAIRRCSQMSLTRAAAADSATMKTTSLPHTMQ